MITMKILALYLDMLRLSVVMVARLLRSKFRSFLSPNRTRLRVLPTSTAGETSSKILQFPSQPNASPSSPSKVWVLYCSTGFVTGVYATLEAGQATALRLGGTDPRFNELGNCYYRYTPGGPSGFYELAQWTVK